MRLSDISYSPLKEEEKSLTGWSKTTIDYVLKNKSKVKSSIRGISKNLNKVLQSSDVEDVYMELLKYLYNCDDYNISKAYERSSSGAIVSLEGYIHICTKYCVKRYITDLYKIEKNVIREYTKDNDGKEMSLFDTISDNSGEISYSNIAYQLDTICKSFEYQRYLFGPDLFQIWFIRLQTIIHNKQDRYKDILSILGISKKEISRIEKETDKDGAMISIAKAVTLIGVDDAVKVLRKYVYSADRIEQVIALF